MKVIELFSGIGSQHAALERLKQGYPDFQYKVIGMAEIDKYAIKSYEAIHGATKNFGDISKIEKLPKADFWTYSFPCQDLSVAGKQKGLGEGTRSGLLYEVERLLEVAKEHDELPTYLMLENVKNLVGKKFKPDFDRWIGKLNQLRYNTYWQVLNAKHYGVPQNRERVFAISILKEFDMGYAFPEPFDNGLRLKDILEDEVDEKFYLSEKIQKRLRITDLKFRKDVVGTTIGDECTRIGQRDAVYHENSTMGALTATDYKQPKQILIPQATTKGYIECSVPGVFDMTYPDSKTRRGRVQDHGEIVPTLTAASQDIMYIEDTNTIITEEPLDRPGWHRMAKVVLSTEGISTTIHCQSNNLLTKIKQPDYRIRKLTPKECFRLMGFTDEQFHKAEVVNSNSQLYKQAGNSIVVDVLYYLFENLFVKQEEHTMQISLF